MGWFNSEPKKDGVQISVSLPVTFIKEGDTTIAYSPVLDLSTCGSDLEEAKKMFSEAVQMFFNDLVENNTAAEVLSGLGWTRTEGPQAGWNPPVISQESVDVRVPALA